LINFAKGNIKRIITKAKMTGMGLNWQHCNHSVFFPTWSYEQYYQAIRRFYRFGQKKEVYVDLVLSDGQLKILESLKIKKVKAEEMFLKLSEYVNNTYKDNENKNLQNINKPKFL